MRDGGTTPDRDLSSRSFFDAALGAVLCEGADGVRDAGAILSARVVAHDDDDGITELAVSAGSLFLPRIEAPPGTMVRVRVEAHDIILTRTPPQDVSTLNILPATVTRIWEGEGPGAAVGLRVGEDLLLARVTRRSVRALALAPGEPCYAMMKSTSIAPRDIGIAAL